MNEIIDNVLVDNFFDNSQFNESLNFEDTFLVSTLIFMMNMIWVMEI